MTIASDDVWFLEVEGRRVDLRAGEVTIGRSRGCGVVLRDPSVSRGHALLSVTGGRATLQDLRSSNGTYVNGRRIDAETPLAEGDRVVIGETALYLRRAGDGAAQPLAASEGAVFCPACGRPVEGEATDCPSCGAALRGARLPRRSEALGLGEVLPVGEVLGSGSASWEQTTFRPGSAAKAAASSESLAAQAEPAAPAAESAASSRLTPPTAYPPPIAPPAAEPPTEAPSLSELPMSVREAERALATPPEREDPPASPPPGLLQRLAERLGLGGRRG